MRIKDFKKYMLFSCLLLFGGAGFSQNKWVTKGDQSFERGDYIKAIEYYHWAAANNDYRPAWLKLGDTYLKLDNYEEAEAAYARVVSSPECPPEYLMKYGKVLMTQGRYPEAKGWFRKAAAAFPDDPRYEELIRSCEEYTSILSDSSLFHIEPLPINSKQTDLGPMFFGNGLVFSSSRKFNLGVVYTSRINGQPLLDLFYSQKEETGEWSKPIPFSFSLNSRFNEGPVSFSPDEDTIYFTRNQPVSTIHDKVASGKEINKLSIYRGVKYGDRFRDIEMLSLNEAGSATGHPALAPDGSFMVFVSDRPGGIGGADLYISRRSGDDWTKPENLGSSVNSPGDEMFPWIHPDGTLYFSSDGWAGLGDLDIFSSRKNGDKWERPVNIGYPVNSTFDDLGIIVSQDKKSGYFSSNRNGGGYNDDLFSFSILRPSFECKPQEENNYCVILFEENMAEVPDSISAGLVFEWNLGNGIFKRGKEVDHCFPGPGLYPVELNVIDQASGFVFYNNSSFDIELKEIEQPYITAPDLAEAGKEISLNGRRSNLPGATIEKYYWDFGDGTTAEGEEVTHSWLQPGSYEIRMGLTGTWRDGNDLLECRTRKIEVYESPVYSLKAEEAERREDSIAEVEKKLVFEKIRFKVDTGSGRDPNEGYVVKDYYNPLKENPESKFTVKITESEEAIAPDDERFKGITGVREFKTEKGYTYTVGEASHITALKPVFSQVVTLGWGDAVVVPFFGDKLLDVPDSTYFVKVPGSNRALAFSVFQGKLVDPEGNPLQADITWEDLTEGKVFTQTTTDTAGNFYLQLPNGKLYGYHVDKEGFFPVSESVDLTQVKQSLKFTGTLETVSVQDMISKGTAVRLNNLFFEPGQSFIRKESNKELDRLARILNENPDLRVEISGHTDDIGPEVYNLELSERRAKAVLKYLVLAGYPIDKAVARGYGEDQPVSPNTTEASRKLNRRVEFRFLDKHP